MSDFEPLTSTTRPLTQCTLTLRIIKSFPYRNVKNVILPSIDLTTTTPRQLLTLMQDMINKEGKYRPYRGVEYDTLKIYTKAHGTKSMNLVINFEKDDEWVLKLDDTKTLQELGVENETEISMFKWVDYEAFKANPEEKW
ncbi:hypothetical protein WICPIJ_004772 [Wickerhamomyces pijperi]|uniref:Altered inheritance rate of mitochondria protein 29 n=1 Tax=Wickerhamomyces pijperi TaxID=599730 RepID=A0A9P8Q714_WICPI|nr:hypothetical protein WICPIJ_004772 [Wickerhamomyces pijperi]